VPRRQFIVLKEVQVGASCPVVCEYAARLVYTIPDGDALVGGEAFRLSVVRMHGGAVAAHGALDLFQRRGARYP
jgi:hypothetical protein